jgi:hypothetical protein
MNISTLAPANEREAASEIFGLFLFMFSKIII